MTKLWSAGKILALQVLFSVNQLLRKSLICSQYWSKIVRSLWPQSSNLHSKYLRPSRKNSKKERFHLAPSLPLLLKSHFHQHLPISRTYNCLNQVFNQVPKLLRHQLQSRCSERLQQRQRVRRKCHQNHRLPLQPKRLLRNHRQRKNRKSRRRKKRNPNQRENQKRTQSTRQPSSNQRHLQL